MWPHSTLASCPAPEGFSGPGAGHRWGSPLEKPLHSHTWGDGPAGEGKASSRCWWCAASLTPRQDPRGIPQSPGLQPPRRSARGWSIRWGRPGLNSRTRRPVGCMNPSPEPLLPINHCMWSNMGCDFRHSPQLPPPPMLPLQILLQLSEEGYLLVLTEVSTLEWESSEPPLKYIWQGGRADYSLNHSHFIYHRLTH